MATTERIVIRRMDSYKTKEVQRPIEHDTTVTYRKVTLIWAHGRAFECEKWKHGGTAVDLETLDDVILEVE